MSQRFGYRIPLHLEPQPEGGFTVTSPALPELLTEGDTIDEAMRNADDAFAAVLELYEEEGRQLPESIVQPLDQDAFDTERLVASA